MSPGHRPPPAPPRSARTRGRCARFWLGVAGLAAGLGVAAPAAGAGVTYGPAYVPVPGSPFHLGSAIVALAANPAGTLLAGADYGGGSIDIASVAAGTGALAPVSGSPVPAGHGPDAVAFSPSGRLLAATSLVDDRVNVYAVSSGGGLTPAASAATGGAPRAVAFSPDGHLLAVANSADATVSVYTVGADGSLTAVSGALPGTATDPVALAFNPAGTLLAVADEGADAVSLFTVDPASGTLTPSAGSPLGVDGGPSALAFNPAGTLLAVANAHANTISIFATGAAASSFGVVPGSPFPTGAAPLDLAFNGDGSLLATADSADGTLALFGVGAAGALTLVQGAPFPAGASPHALAFLPQSRLIAAASGSDGTVSLLQPMPAPTATVSLPAGGQTFVLGQRVPTTFSCADPAAGPGIASCTDAQGASAPSGTLDTRRLGPHTYTVTAVSRDGLSATTSVAYTVLPVPAAVRRPPTISGTPSPGATLHCARGRWSHSPSSYTYQWDRGGLPLDGETGASHRVTRLDEGSQIACTVTAHNGNTAQVTSAAVTVPLVVSRSCPAPMGALTATRVGLVHLGQTWTRARAALRRSRVTSTAATRTLCLAPAGITVGFADATLAQLLHAPAARNRVVWVLTANPYYRVGGVGSGESLAEAEHQLPGGTVERSGPATVYLVRGPVSTVALVARGTTLEEIGLAADAATANPGRIAALVAALAATV